MPGKALHLYLGLVDNILRITAAPVCVYACSGSVSSPSRLILEGIYVVVVNSVIGIAPRKGSLVSSSQ